MKYARTFAIPALLALAAVAPRPARAQAAASLVPMPRAQFFDSAGRPLAGGCVWTYAAGSSTPLNSYKNAAGTANANPVVLDSAGRADIWLGAGSAYKISVAAKTSAGCVGATTPLYTADGVIDQGFALVRQLQNGSLAIGLRGLPLTGTGGGVGIGNAMLSATVDGLYVSVNGAAPVLLSGGGGTGGGGAAAGPATSLQYNGGGTPAALAGSANLKWDNGGKDLVICGAPATGCTATSGVEAPTFSSFGAAANSAFITNVTGGAVGSSHINNDGNAFFQGVDVTNTFTSRATGPTLAITQSTKTFNITGAGDAGFQTVGIGLHAMPTQGFGGGQDHGEALLSATTAGLYLSLDGAPPVLVGGGGGSGTPGTPTTSVQFNNAGTFAGSANLKWDGAGNVLIICGPPATGCTATSAVQAPVFSSSAAASDAAFVTNGGGPGTSHINGDGNGYFQGLNVTATFNSLATGTTKAIAQAANNFFITGAGDSTVQTNGMVLHASPTTGISGEARLSATTAGLFISLNAAPPVPVGGGGSGTPGAPATSVQFNNAGAFAGSANFTWNSASNVMTVAGTSGTSGIIAPTFTGNATGANLVFQTSGNTWQVDTAGNTSQNGTLNVTGASPTINVISAAGIVRTVTFKTGVNNRWVFGVDSGAESGGNAGSGIFLNRYTDAGAGIDTPLQILRSDGIVRMSDGWITGAASLTAAGVLTVASCTGCGGGLLPAGSFQQVQFNNGTTTAFGASGNFTWDTTNNVLNSPVFSCTTTTANYCFKTSTGNASIQGNGQFQGQSIALGGNNGTSATAGAGGTIANAGAAGIGLVVYDTNGHCNLGSAGACSSDERLKKNIAPIGDALKAVNALRPVAFDWRGNGEHGFGFIAQEVQKVLPGLVTTDKGGYLELSEMNMIPYLVRSIQQLQEEVDTLRSRVGVRLLNEQLSK